MSLFALKQPHPDGGEWIQEFDTREEAVSYQADNGGVLVMSAKLPGQPGLWWVEVIDAEQAPPSNPASKSLVDIRTDYQCRTRPCCASCPLMPLDVIYPCR